MKPDFHCVRTQWIRGFIAFRLRQNHTGSGVHRVPVSPAAVDLTLLAGFLG
jgi:hypothetical protein